jgi:hypothetical protein
MQTTLRLDDQLYREAKAEAAREGLTLTRFLEEGIRLRLARTPNASQPLHTFRVFAGDSHFRLTDTAIRSMADEEQEKHDIAKLNLPRAS